MKSNQSFFNATVFKKNLARFSPAWGLYTLWLVLATVSNCSRIEWAGSSLLQLGHANCIVAFFYAPLCSQLLFGDLLYNTRMCNALHALPLKRETWFFTNVLSGFLFHLIPAVIASVVAWLLLAGNGYQGNMAVAPLFLLTVTLEFACFFGISTFASFFAGSRFAHAVVYVLLNFGSIILCWLVNELYISAYYGVELSQAAFQLFSPMARMMEESFLEVDRQIVTDYLRAQTAMDSKTILLGENFAYFFGAAAAGLILILTGLWLYRRRKLESAGDFLAIRALEPVFSVVYTLSVGTFFYMIFDGPYLFVGLFVGWFTCRMLLERTAQVFRKKNFLRFGGLIGIFLLSLAITSLDPLGIENWIPVANKVESVTIAEGTSYYQDETVTLKDPRMIEKVLALHQSALEEYHQSFPHQQTFDDAKAELIDETLIPDDMDRYIAHVITYRLTSGRTVSRYYLIWMGDEDGRFLREAFSSPEAVFGYEENLDRFLEENNQIRIRDTWQGYDTILRSQADIAGLYQALIADARAGNLVQSWTYQREEQEVYWIILGDRTQLTIYSCCENTLNWLKAYGLNVDEILRQLSY